MSEVESAGARLGATAAAWSIWRYVQAGEWEVRHRAAGSGPPVVLVHGLSVSADYWIRNGPPLAAAGFQVLAPDLPGFGRTHGPRTGLSVPEQAAALVRWAEALELGPAVYVGHSLSCQAVLELAAREPERVRGLVLVGPTGAPVPRRQLRQLWRLALDLFREEWKLITLVGWAYLQTGPLRFLRTWSRGAEHDPLPLLPRVRAPGLVVVGTRDPVVHREFAHALAGGLPSGRLAWIAGAAHAAQFGGAEQFNREVLAFLRSLPDPPLAAPRSPSSAAEEAARDGR